MTQKVTFDNSIKANFEDDTYQKIEELAIKKGDSKSGIVRSIVRQELRG